MSKELPFTNLPSRVTEVPSGFVIRHSDFVLRASTRGAAMLAVLMFIMVSAIAITAWIQLTGARLHQTEQLATVVQRHLLWNNSMAVEKQYAFTWAMRDDITRAAVSTALADGWGGAAAQAFGHLTAFATTERASNATVSYPFNNLRPPGTTDGGVYFERTDASTDNSQTEKLTFYNYIKTYSSTLLGDLFVIHKRPTSSGTYSIAGTNFQVNGRAVIYDGTATTSTLRATSYVHEMPTLTNAVLNITGTATLPQNYPVRPAASAGYGGTAVPSAVTDGTMNMIKNTNFTSGSLFHIATATGLWMTGTTSASSSTNIKTDQTSGSSSSDTQVLLQNTPYSYPQPPSPYNYTVSGSLNVLKVRLNNSSLKHLIITGGVEQLVLDGQTTASQYTAAASLGPIIVVVADPNLRDIRFIGENSRPFILGLGLGTGNSIYLGFESASILGGSNFTRWRMQLLNEYRAVGLHSKRGSSKGVTITGAVRTNWQINCADGNSAINFIWNRDTEPDRLAPFMPRDGWVETCLMTQ